MKSQCHRFVKYKLQDKDSVDLVQEVGSAYASESKIRGVTITFKVDAQKYHDFLNLMVGWELCLVLPSAIDRAQFQIGIS